MAKDYVNLYRRLRRRAPVYDEKESALAPSLEPVETNGTKPYVS
jgi:hypothetical protein